MITEKKASLNYPAQQYSAVNQMLIKTSCRMNVQSGLFLGILLFCGFLPSLGAQWSLSQSLTVGGSIGSPGGTHPLVTDGDTVHAVWWQSGAIRYRRSHDAGRSWTEAVSLTTGGKAGYPCSLELADTVLHLIWTDSRNGGWELYYMCSTDAGKTWGKEVRLAPGIDQFRFGSAVSGKNVHIVWGSKSRLEKVPAGKSTWTWTWGDIYHLCSSDGGTTWEKPVRLNQKPGTAMRPVVAVSGRFVHVAWYDQYAAKQKPGWDWDIYYRRSTDSGAHWGPEVRMTDTPTHSRHPQIVATPGNRVCCIWEDGQTFDGVGMVGDPALYAAVSTDNGETWRKIERITAVNAPNGFATHAKTYAFGSRVHLTWQDAPEGPEKPPAVYYMTSVNGGLTWEAPDRLTEPSEGNWETGAVVGTESWALVEMMKGSDLWYCRRDLTPGRAAQPKQGMSMVTHIPPGHTAYRIRDKAVCAIDDRLFGQFMERPSWGETGVEGAVVAGTNRLQPEALRLLAELRMPIVRFPGGTDVNFMDWRDMVSNVPGRGTKRPTSTGHTGKSVTNRFGYDEFLGLCQDLKTEPILVVNFQDALLRRKPAKEAALHAAALVAYANAPQGARLPDGMIDWPAVRAQNGAQQPWGVKYFQVGNETWIALDALRKQGMANTDIPKHYADCLAAYVEAMRSVNPSIRIIADACNAAVAARIHEQLGDRIQYWVQHEYMPWGIDFAKLRRAGAPVAMEQLTAEEVWKAWVAIPQSFNAAGESTISGAALEAARKYGGKAAITEWNWNGGWRRPSAPLDWCFAKGVGAAGYLHAFMRTGDIIEIACQSMTVGHAWPITAIHVNPAGRASAYMMPTGQVVMFYAKHHGSALLEMEGMDIPGYSQTLTCGSIRPHEKVAYVDALATADGKAVYFHAINRHFSEDVPVTVNLLEFPGLAAEGVQHLFEGRLNDKPDEGEAISAGSFRDVRVSREGTVLRIVLPKRSVSIVEIGRTRG